LRYLGVVVSYVGREHLDVSGESFAHRDLVERGRKGVWVEPLLRGVHRHLDRRHRRRRI
jgi:hypothetical protein